MSTTAIETPAKRVFKRPETREERDAFVRDNTGLVYLALDKFQRRLPKRRVGFDEDDLVQAGLMALLNAAELFDPDRGFQFSTYAMRAIFHRMRRVVDDDDDSRAHRWGARQVRLGTPARKCEDATIADLVVDHRDDERRRMLARDELAASGWHLLFPRQREVLTLRFLEGRTMAEVGERLGVSRARVEQIEKQAVARMAAWRVRRDGGTPPEEIAADAAAAEPMPEPAAENCSSPASDSDLSSAAAQVAVVLADRGWTAESEIRRRIAAMTGEQLDRGLEAAVAAGLVERMPLATGESIWRATGQARAAHRPPVNESQRVPSVSVSPHEAA